MNTIIWLILGGAVVVAVVVFFILNSGMTGDRQAVEYKKEKADLKISVWQSVKLGFGFGAGLFLWGLLLAVVLVFLFSRFITSPF